MNNNEIKAEKEVRFAWYVIGNAEAIVNDYGEVYTDKEKRISKIILNKAKEMGLYETKE